MYKLILAVLKLLLPIILLLTAYHVAYGQTGECTYIARNGLCRNYYTEITEDSNEFICELNGNKICSYYQHNVIYPTKR